MAKITCAICSKSTESHYLGVKHCSNCNRWFCYDHAGPGAKQCPICKKNTLVGGRG